MVKSEGYGHGAAVAARAALEGGATWLGVYAPDEALALRVAGFSQPLLVAGWSPPSAHEALIRAAADITIFDVASVEALAGAASAVGTRARVHVKLDSGLGRLGVRPSAVEDMVHALERAHRWIDVAGIFTHYADAESDPAFTQTQHQLFLDVVERFRSVAAHALLHTCGSAGILRSHELHHDLVRLGIGMYGYDPRGGAPRIQLQPAMSVFARVAQVKTLAAGESVGYGRTWKAPGPSRIATVAIGYGQGVPRALSNRGSMVVHAARCPIVGAVSMDQVTLDVSALDAVSQGDAAMFFGRRDGVQLGADEVAELLGTISYEVLCGISAQVPRVPVDGAASGG